LLLDRLTIFYNQLNGGAQSAYCEEVLARDIKLAFFTSKNSQRSERMMHSLMADKEFMLRFQLVNMARNHNALGEVNSIMRKFARICVSLDSGIANRLEAVMNSEVSIDHLITQHKSETNYPVNPMVLAQPNFVYLSAPEKLA
jgi:hypothetical protein